MMDINVKYYKKLYINDSNIAEKGLFASEDIAIGELILSFGGMLSFQEERYSGKFLSSTCVGISEDIILCEDVCSDKDFSDYINHSCNPNAGLFDSISIIAITQIKSGEEIFCDYAFWEACEDWIMKNECLCGSENCRKRIDGKHWKNVKTTDVNFNFYSPFLKRRIINYEKKS